MLIAGKDLIKLGAIAVVICCAVFVCAIFLNYGMDLAALEDELTNPVAQVMYDAQMSTVKMVSGLTGGSLVATSVVLLIFYIRNFIDTHGRDLGILKALGHSNMHIATHFWVFGMSALVGAGAGLGFAWLYMPSFYVTQNEDGLLPEMEPAFHAQMVLWLVVVPTLFFTLLAILYAAGKLRRPVLTLLKDTLPVAKACRVKEKDMNMPFLPGLRRSTLRSRRILVFFVWFSAFCFSALTQMSASMQDLASEEMGWLMLVIGLVLAFMSLGMSMSTVLKANTRTLAMMKVFGYSQSECVGAVLSGYRPVAWIGFACGTVYQYLLLRLMVDIVFKDIPDMPTYAFEWPGFWISLIAFIAVYETAMWLYAQQIRTQSVKSIMLEG